MILDKDYQWLDQAFVGRMQKGPDLLGYHIRSEGLSVAKKTIDKYLTHTIGHYGQERGKP